MSSESVLEIHSLLKVLGGRQILKGCTAAASKGQVIGLLGKNGAGKSTLIELILGFAIPDAGYCRVFGEEGARMSAACKARIGFVPQQDDLIPLMTGEQHLALTASFHQHWDHALVQRLARQWEVPLARRAGVLSGGERQKIATLLALGHRPEFLVMDEPASGLDPVARRQFMLTILEIAADADRTVLYSSHIVSDIERVASHLWIMREGEMAWQGELDQLKESVVRLHLHAEHDLPLQLALPGQLHCRIDGRNASVIVRDWHPARQGEFEALTGTSMEVEALGLEDIFLEVNA
ncbi:MAG: ABC transporter ATP-binding protein [Steroidobacteraceae bacterium]